MYIRASILEVHSGTTLVLEYLYSSSCTAVVQYVRLLQLLASTTAVLQQQSTAVVLL